MAEVRKSFGAPSSGQTVIARQVAGPNGQQAVEETKRRQSVRWRIEDMQRQKDSKDWQDLIGGDGED